MSADLGKPPSDAKGPFEVSIRDVAFGGAGVGVLPDGRIAFVPFTLSGERVRIRLTRARKGFAEAELLEVLEPSPHRIPPHCAHFGICGGCQYQHATYEEQLRIKTRQVRDALERLGGLRNLPELHVESAPRPFGYRNKISVHLGPRNELGFYATDHRTVVDVPRCPIANEVVNNKLTTLRQTSRKPLHASLSDAAERAASPEGTFHQVNTDMAAQLLAWVRAQLGTVKGPRLVDAYCGSGFFTLGLAQFFDEVCGVDRDERAIHAATVSAQKTKLSHVHFFAAAVEERLGWLLDHPAADRTTILLDPPREGLPPSVTRQLADTACARLIYVSCNPATLARDLKILTGAPESRLAVERLALFDMFPQTAHIETVAVLEREV